MDWTDLTGTVVPIEFVFIETQKPICSCGTNTSLSNIYCPLPLSAPKRSKAENYLQC